eukprot:TRINITY_DN10336_c0_g1_i1.p2 TRINITY_DN10336_c0_g1~~TRINITY_DN10336_c0_g1_i1.p2  ORF type:complete len:239 (-),score=32.86 TRINITY_DN10336_c0_g1_i1:82-798(-)
MALETQIVSQTLHRWIDLIFGYQQTGEEAIKANNVFFSLTYEGGLDINGKSQEEIKALLAQIQNFGQTPHQLLEKPHPRKEHDQQLDPISQGKFTQTNIISLNDILLDQQCPVEVLHVQKSSDSGGSNNFLSLVLSNKTVLFIPGEIHRYGVTYNFLQKRKLSNIMPILLGGNNFAFNEFNKVQAIYFFKKAKIEKLFVVGGDKYCLLYTSDAADEEDSVDLGGCRIIKKKKKKRTQD